MIADLLPLMTDTVRQIHVGARDLSGKIRDCSFTEHRARVIYSPGKMLGQASREATPDAIATIWLADHPHPIAVGDAFELPETSPLKVARFERRKLPDGVLHKVYLT